MSKISRNEICPCGSGIKYKKCCIDKIINFPDKNINQEDKNGLNKNSMNSDTHLNFFEMAKKEFSQKKINSIDDTNQHLKVFSKHVNNLGRKEFLGLSANQMSEIIYQPINLNQGLVRIERLNPKQVLESPLIKQTLYLFKRMHEEKGFKATQKGNLPRSIVQEMYHQFFKNEEFNFIPLKEDDLPEIQILRHIFELGGFIKKRTNKFTLTKKGGKFLDLENINSLFLELFQLFSVKWNWDCLDGYPEFPIIQNSLAFNLYLLAEKAQDWIGGEDLARYFLTAFPHIIKKASGRSDAESEVKRCFEIRFLERYCEPLGFIEIKYEGEKYFDRRYLYKVSPFFKSCFEFNSSF